MINFHCLLIRTCQYNLRPPTHTKCTLVRIQGFSRELLTLLQHELIQIRQNRRIETNAILHQKNQLHTDFLHIVFQIHLVFYQFDNRHQQVGIAQPTEYIFKRTQIFIDNPFGNTMAKRSQDHDRNMLVFLFDMATDVETVIIPRARHTNHQVERHIFQLRQCFLLCGYLRETRRITQR